MKCKYCGSETNKQTIFGVLERTHYDDRHDTTQTDTGPTTYQAIALVQLSYCDSCIKSFKNTYTSKNLGIGILCLIGSFILFIIASSCEDTAREIFFICFGVCVLAAVSFLFEALHTSLLDKKSAFEKICLKKYSEKGTIDSEDVIISSSNPPIDVKPMKGTLSNRWDISYQAVTSKKLKKMNKERVEKGLADKIESKRKAIAFLKCWYDNISKNI